MSKQNVLNLVWITTQFEFIPTYFWKL